MSIMTIRYCRLNVSQETSDVIKRCIEELRKEKPQEFLGMNITQDFIIRRVSLYYLGERF